MQQVTQHLSKKSLEEQRINFDIWSDILISISQILLGKKLCNDDTETLQHINNVLDSKQWEILKLKILEFIGDILLRNTCFNSQRDLTKKEKKVFDLMYDRPWYIFSREDFLDALWDVWEIDDRAIDVYIEHIRPKLPLWIRIKTMYGAGYYMELWTFNIEDAIEKIEISENIFLIPQIYTIFSFWESAEIVDSVQLTHWEFKILNKLISRHRVKLSRWHLKEIVGGNIYTEEKSMDTHIKKIRQKLNALQKWLWGNIIAHRWIWFSWK